ncbi:MAG: hypothetical protein CFE46_06110 [Burkholderiales bacterium PBB6]|nr:MAG: hypothetical protein CFE46_06110 [Burkholderiales bacterium PBB6]
MVIALSLSALASLAIVTQDASPLRAAPRDSATTQAQLTAGDALEVRGQRLDYLQVWDHRRERGGFIRASQVKLTGTTAADAPELLAWLRFVRDTPGQEALGTGLAAAWLKAAPAQTPAADTVEALDALGSMADRVARRASSSNAAGNAQPTAGTNTRLTAQLDGMATYGVRWISLEVAGQMRICYDGEAFRRVLAQPAATPEQRARAALGLTRHDCVDPATPVSQRDALDRWRADVLDRVTDADMATLPELWRQRIFMRRAGVWASVAFGQARRQEAAALAASAQAGQRALTALAAVNKNELTDDDLIELNDAAMRVGASRWAAEPAVAVTTAGNQRLRVLTTPGSQPGETCVLLTDAGHGPQQPLLRHCTFSVVWPASASVNTAGTAVSLAVQPLATWRELWLMKRTPDGWVLDVLPPATGNPLGTDIGVVEFAGWVGDGEPRVLVSREARVDGRYNRRFEVSRIATGEIDKQASTPQLLSAFQRWQDAGWKRQTVMLR